MPKWLKVVLALLGVVMLLCGVSSAAAYFWFDANKDKLKGVGERAKKEGAAYAGKADAEGCVDEGLRRLAQRSGIVDQAEHKLFLKACLEKAQRPDGFCTGVPAQAEIMASAAWAMERCGAKGKPKDQECARLMQGVQAACQTSPTPLTPG